MRRVAGAMLLLALSVGLPWRLEAASLKVAPARFIVHNVDPGKPYDIYAETGLRLTIYNDDDVARTWVLSTHRPSDRGKWEKGYTEIPDPAWCWFEQDEVTVPAKSKTYANLHLKAPDEEQYYNQHWVATLSVEGKPSHGGISLAVDVRAQIETKSKAGLTTTPYGELGLEPSTVRFEDMSPGESRKAEFVIHNGHKEEHTYAIASLFNDAEVDKRTYLTHSYEAAPDSEWVRYKDNVTIPPKGRAAVRVEVHIPAAETRYGKKWEDVLLIEPDEGLPAFVRVQVVTTENSQVE